MILTPIFLTTSPRVLLLPNLPPLETAVYPPPRLDTVVFVPRRLGSRVHRRTAVDSFPAVRGPVGLASGRLVVRRGRERSAHRFDLGLLAGWTAG